MHGACPPQEGVGLRLSTVTFIILIDAINSCVVVPLFRRLERFYISSRLRHCPIDMHRTAVYFARLLAMNYNNFPSAHARILDLFAISSLPFYPFVVLWEYCCAFVFFFSLMRVFSAADHRVLEPAQNAGDRRLHGATLPLAVRGIDVHHQHVDCPCRAHGVLSIEPLDFRGEEGIGLLAC